MTRSVISGTGIGVPSHILANDDLSKIMDTSDEWIRKRSGIEQRYVAAPGQGSAELGSLAAENAIKASGCEKAGIDAVIFATMTPDYLLPGNGPLLQRSIGLPQSIPTFDIRQQCSGFLYGLDLADSLIRSGKHQRVLLVGAEVHSPFMPWENGWDVALGIEEREVSDAEKRINTRSRDRTVLFGDGAGAVIVEASNDEGRGYLTSKLYTDGSAYAALHLAAPTFLSRPFVTAGQIEREETMPVMEGKEVFRHAVAKMPAAVREVTQAAGFSIEDLDLVLVHQANLRIIEGVQKSLGLPAERVPHNIEKYGNTTAATLPILLHECYERGMIRPGMLIAFTALGSGLHWGASLYRV